MTVSRHGTLLLAALWLAGVAAAAVVPVDWLRSGTVGALAIAAIGILAAQRRGGGLTNEWSAALAFVPVHLLVVATGQLGSPLMPVAGLWAVAVVWAGSRRWSLPLVLVAGFLLLAVAVATGAPLIVPGLAAAVVALGGGAALGTVLRAQTARLRLQQQRLRALEDQARRAGEATIGSASDRTRRLEQTLDSLRAQTGAGRVVVWRVDRDQDRLVPKNSVPGPPPRPVNLSGSPLRWVWEERTPLRLEGRTSAAGAVQNACVAPVDDEHILSFEFEPARLPADPDWTLDVARYVSALLEMHASQAQADTARTRFNGLLGVLEKLAASADAAGWGATLAETSRTLAGGTGAAVGTWAAGGGGIVLAAAGEDGGPAAGAEIDPIGSEMGVAARAGSPIFRPRQANPSQLPIASGTERWYAAPRAVAVLPLTVADTVNGVLVVWNADFPELEEQGLATLRTLAPYAALQLNQMMVQATLRDRAERDALTGLPNRGAFTARMETEIAHFRRYRRPLSLIAVDVDHFKRVNDTWGHDAGDEVLRSVAHVVAHTVRETDFAARLGGEEFVVVLPETDLPQAMETAERIRTAVETARIEHAGNVVETRVSLGVAACPTVVSDPGELIGSADAALYASKHAGRNRVTAASGRGTADRRFLAHSDDDADPESAPDHRV